MKKHYWFIIIAYMILQLTGYLGIQLLNILNIGETNAERFAFWTIFSFTLTLLIILYLLRNERHAENRFRGEPASVGASVAWAIIGFFMAIFVQGLAANIEVNIFGVDPGSENTQRIVNMIELFPLVILVTSIIGPILEEIIFRKILFGVLYTRTNFFIAALISSLIFSLLHGEPQHVLLYGSMGFTFAFLYVKTKRILVPIFAHVSMNTMVVVIQTVFRDDIEKMMEQMEQMEQLQVIIGGFLT
ncbi:CPBP family intramembrane metalloprotease [Bacillus sp. UMB0899]|uniref:CPBP family intramembrane glutamic endopeptidase n=1 Tax=Metabacillus schmidteae TaxID=2730405 RepID=UPI000C7FDD08|nr:CPBP family intramembrane glutamic endopeptidase [Metabacillus schmidteae]PMC33945.1 CPBP family intramembrane metalloprotease [Bacillus sp. UMB0899]